MKCNLQLLKHIFAKRKNNTNNCLVCLTHTVANGVVFILPIKAHCRHKDQNYEGFSKYELNKSRVVFSYIFALILFSNCLFHIFKTINSCQIDIIVCLTSIEEYLIVLTSATLILLSLWKTNYSTKLLNHISEILDKKNFYNFRNIICEECSDSLIFRNRMRFLILLVFHSFMIILYVILNGIYGLSISDICFALCYGLQISIVLGTISLEEITERICQSFQNGVKDVMESRIEKITNEDEFIINIKKMQQMYMEILIIFDGVNRTLSPALLLWSISTLITLVLNIYHKVLLLNGNSLTIFICIYFRTLISIGAIIIISVKSERIAQIIDDTLSYLFKYPVSKLNEMEAYQVEMLINTLCTRKPVMKASDIFNVESKLIASVSGTIVTYVLVALQFRPVWNY